MYRNFSANNRGFTYLLSVDNTSETICLLKTTKIRQFGDYRTQRLVLEAWDRLFGG